VADIFAKTAKGEYTAQRRKYALELALERLTGIQPPVFVSWEMKQGTEREPESCEAYAMDTGQLVEEVGFIFSPNLMVGASPDRLVGEKGGLETKNPLPITHLGYLEGDFKATFGVPPEYLPQVLHNLWITGRAWWDFQSYCRDFPPAIRAYRVRVEAEEVASQIASHDKGVREFLAEVDAVVARIGRLAA
ncbi:MAG: YqaJ viral recombinase family protein, partial [Rhodospirillales bacterium]|nr:YqaJ viral recombinase family protein [Rhodospirillales bacterium]